MDLSNMRIIDLSQNWDGNTPSFATYEGPTVKWIKRPAFEKVGGQFISSTLHVGTHLDAPLHFITNGQDIGSIPLSKLVGPGDFHAQVKQKTRAVNRLHNLLARAFPELATVTDDIAVGWVLQLLETYPQAELLKELRLPILIESLPPAAEVHEVTGQPEKRRLGSTPVMVTVALSAENVSPSISAWPMPSRV